MTTPLEIAAACPEYQAAKAAFTALREAGDYGPAFEAARDRCNNLFRAIQEQWQAERDEAAKQARERTHGRLDAYLATLKPLEAGRQRKSLERLVRSSHGILARFALVERKLADGWTLDGDGLRSPCGEYWLGADGLTSYGIAFARWLERGEC